jgi:hypothetical protein
MNWLTVVCLRAENSRTRKRETMPLEGELRDVIERRRAAAILKDEDGGSRFAEYVFHRDGQPNRRHSLSLGDCLLSCLARPSG